MALISKKYSSNKVINEIIDYTIEVPFHNSCSICEHTVTSNDVLSPSLPAESSGAKQPVPGYGALYRLIGDGVHTPTFDANFKKSSASGNYDNTLGVVNLVSFIFDGAYYWYSIIQPV